MFVPKPTCRGIAFIMDEDGKEVAVKLTECNNRQLDSGKRVAAVMDAFSAVLTILYCVWVFLLLNKKKRR